MLHHSINSIAGQQMPNGWVCESPTNCPTRRFTMQQFNFDTVKAAFTPTKFIDQAEKNAQAILAYVEPKELGETLVSLTSASSNFARAQVQAINSITAMVKSQAEEFSKSFTNSKATAE